MLTRTGRWARARAAATDPFTDVYGAARTLLALGTLGTLLFSHSTSLFRPAVGTPVSPVCDGVATPALFCLAAPDHLEWGRWAAVAILALVASGWRPRITGPLHFYVAYSLNVTGLLVDGGDQVTAILALLLLPVTLADGRRWHWTASPRAAPGGGGSELLRLVALSSLWMIRLQVAGIYFHAAVGKMPVPEWRNGTAVYYWFTDPAFGLPEYLRPLVMPLLTTAVGVAALTWGAIMLEVTLFTGLVMERRWRAPLLVAGLLFHLGIALVHGLPSFAFAMWGALVLFLRPVDLEFGVAAAVQRMRERARGVLRPATAPAPALASSAAAPEAGAAD